MHAGIASRCSVLADPVRVGLADGPAVALHGDYYGPVVNLAARLVAVAPPSSVLVSDTVRGAAVAGDLAFEPFETGPVRGFTDVTTAFRLARSRAPYRPVGRLRTLRSPSPPEDHVRRRNPVSWRTSAPFIICHFVPLLGLFTGFHAIDLVLLVVAVLGPDVLRHRGLPPVLRAQGVPDEPRHAVRPRLRRTHRGAEGSAVVGGPPPDPSPLHRHRPRPPFASRGSSGVTSAGSCRASTARPATT